MRITLKTLKLQEMVARSIKGASNNKLIPLTGLMSISLKGNVLTLTTTDASNYLYIREDKVEGDDFYVTVQVETFSKLISRMTCENVTIILHPEIQVLEVKGNGDYKIELPVDENGQLIKYPDPLADFQPEEESNTTVQLSTIDTILNTVKSALATTLEIPCYTGYYVGDSVIATDTYKIAGMDATLFEGAKRLISPEMMNLLAVMTAEKVSVDINDNIIVFSSPDCVVYGNAMEGIEDYAVDAITSLIKTDFQSVCKLSKSALLQLLDRLALFVNTYDKNGVYLTFTKSGLQISSKASSGVEIIPYIESTNFKDFTCVADISMLTQEVKAIASETIELYYGQDNAIKMEDGNITIIVALLEDDRA